MSINSRALVFVVGMPRSGTKLFRDLLNNHSQISIPEVETHFLPLFIKSFGKNVDFKIERDNIFNAFEKTSFYWNSKTLPHFNAKLFSANRNEVTDWRSFGLYIFKYFGPTKLSLDIIYGDKTPGYINHLYLIKEIFPDARIIHIIRDPRDFCISVKNIWNKSMFRAADTWNKTLANSTSFNATFSGDYIEVKYEDVITDAVKVMKRVSTFLDIDFESTMTKLTKSAENYGAAKGSTEILKDNQQKFLRLLDKNSVRRIEEIAYDQMKRLGYNPVHAQKSQGISKSQLLYLKGYDAVNSSLFHVKEKGLLSGLSYFFKLHNQSSWRQ